MAIRRSLKFFVCIGFLMVKAYAVQSQNYKEIN